MHLQEDFTRHSGFSESTPSLSDQGYAIEALSARDERTVKALIHKNMDNLPEAGSVLAATFRRMDRLLETYASEGARFFVVRDLDTKAIIGCVGIGPMAGLPYTEGVGEVRDMVIDTPFRGKGMGRRLLERCMHEANLLAYKRIYLETTPQMEIAQQLFTGFGFKPVQQQKSGKPGQPISGPFPCYFVLDLMSVPPEALEDE